MLARHNYIELLTAICTPFEGHDRIGFNVHYTDRDSPAKREMLREEARVGIRHFAAEHKVQIIGDIIEGDPIEDYFYDVRARGEHAN